MRVAVIDTGTNSTRLLVADVAHGGIREIFKQTRITRLGEKVDSEDVLAAEARNRVADCVKEYKTRIDALDVERTMILATSSMRDARNGRKFLQSLAEGSGFDWKLLSGNEEAGLSFAGATSAAGVGGPVNLFDIGGGSTEVVSGKDGAIVFAASLPMGCVRMTERFMTADPVDPDELETASAFIDEMLRSEIEPDRLENRAKTIAVAGTVTTLASVDLGLERYDPARVHGHVMSLSRVQGFLGEFSGMTLEERMSLATLEPGRADVIVAGILILERLMRYTGASELMVSELDILDGAALAMAAGEL